MASIRVLIADDHRLMRRLLAFHLSTAGHFEVVGEAEDGRQAVDMAFELRPDVILMDLNMPHLNGAQATERILARHPHIKVVIITDLEELAPMGRFSGAVECLDKGCEPQEVAAAVRRAHAAATHEPEPGGAGLGAAMDRMALRHGLTAREKAVCAKAVGSELSTQEIARELSRELGTAVTPSAIKHTMQRVMTKIRLEPRTRAALVKRVLQQ